MNPTFFQSLHPAAAVRLPVRKVLAELKNILGKELLKDVLQPAFDPPSPVAQHTDSQWIKRANMVGINVRTIQNFWNVIPYTLTLPTAQNSIHLLPIWECGVVASLYGMSSWNINTEFFSAELAAELPHLDTVEKQLKVVINILHAVGKTVGMDVIPHTDRYSEIVLANPSHFEWLQRRDFDILNHDNNLHEAVQQQLMRFLIRHGTGTGSRDYPKQTEVFFSENYEETERCKILFGEKNDIERRRQRRDKMVQWLYDLGLETVPATMAPPYRGLAVNRSEAAKTVDKSGRVWRDYVMTKPRAMSRVFGPLTRYKLYENDDYNWQWQINFDAPKGEVWYYVCSNYDEIQADFGFDFMRGDMSHVQMRAEGVPAEAGIYYDIHRAVKLFVQREKPYFGYFAETFLAPPDEMAYGDECDHLELSEADSTLGDLQSVAIHKKEFYTEFLRYWQILKSRTFAPNFTVMTADKDDPRFDSFYLKGNEVRMFMAFFLTDMPSYTALGFECRDAHPTPAPNEHYTKLYVFQLDEGEKATHGNYQWGKNEILFQKISRLRNFADNILPEIKEFETKWLLLPDADAEQKVLVWTQTVEPKYVFVVNLDTQNAALPFSLDAPFRQLQPVFSTENPDFGERKKLTAKEYSFKIPALQAGEAVVYRRSV